ncbi:MAG: hypothetical protein A2504_11945 [Bdellovibrionales bacterium RIFOXYD12_FULL_39_22]|nr:MAG: hypothetical protein A2385_16460 [Bdellovibrionales bacterium RIFOXYB1_FULL_39_21]OFZ44451.1 MAG: hypothetical protein A2485_06435 [Bdellovibrionales bacterium RIFOXYC12_FULL_39_17]OFZ49907.1 MAG: hypothetical protein A2404_01030 [Bdellovibrionales bacterium RIFOXYC1_FULL_39_130]OFZ76912.1 MAG: hypothetical protein A2560_05830 [Bdellovibrionales bacterium RIFOXYD1_FULL_39_84]OFZ95839.1 MAG: hypothetical protein A2504_11945 [Bdellovibrionales bacterium RIFOXYD12_FULL_39_22]HLE10860.1 pr
MELSQKTATDVKAIIPEIVERAFSVDGIEWKIYFYHQFTPIFETADRKINPQIIERIRPYLTGKFTDFRTQIHLKSVALMVGFFFQSRQVRIYTQRLNYELFLLQESESIAASERGSNFDIFKSHTELVAALVPEKFPSVLDVVTHKNKLTDLIGDGRFKSIEGEIDGTITKLIEQVSSYQSTLFEKFTDWGLSLTASFALLRIHLLKFIAILPSLEFDSGGKEVKRILLESLRRLFADNSRSKGLGKKGQQAPIPEYVDALCRIIYYIAIITPASWLAQMVRGAVKMMARRFIAGETIETANKALTNLFNTKRDVTLDQLGELVVSEKEADKYCDEVIKLIRGFSLHVPRGEKNGAGINRAHVSIKVSALCSDFKPYAEDYTYSLVGPRLSKILLAAKAEDVFINVDSEHYDFRDIVFKIYKRVLLETPELADYANTGIVLQAYLRDASNHLDDILELARARKLCMPIRIVKGAYWDAETVHADVHSFDAPEFLNKEETDLHYRQLIVKILENHPHLQLVVASHNFADHSFAEVVREKFFTQTPTIEHQCLDMTYEALSTGMAKMGWPVRNYVPVGSLLVGMAYLVRRIMENSSQVGVLTIMRSHVNPKSIRPPHKIHQDKKEHGELARDMSIAQLTNKFFNIAPARLYVDDERNWLLEEFETFKKNRLGTFFKNNFPLNGNVKTITSSSDPSIIVGTIKEGTIEDTNHAVTVAQEAYNSGKWAKARPIYRASVLLNAALLMTSRRNELSGLITFEAGKTFNEALADVDEAIDFLNFYAREEVKINKENPKIISRGVMSVVSPWNFPIAIPCGMVVSCLVAGNAVILKSASQTPLIAQCMVDIMHEAGVPQDILIHLVGSGATVGDVLVQHPLIAGMVFTGSKEVGMSITHKIGKRIITNELFGVKYPTKVITEMGGKNAIVVTANAELDETVSGILYSAFGHSGQKCSAASRVLVDNRVKDRLIARLREAVRDLKVGKAFEMSTTVNPLITMKEKTRLQSEVKLAAEEAQVSGGHVIIDRTQEVCPGNCVGPAVIELPTHRALKPSSFAMKELFGPVIHVIGFESLDEAIAIFNGTEYALTGGIFGQSQDDVDYLSKRLECGNLYVNRSTTGARVAIEPFGGFKLSGTGPKAGGRSYVYSFHVNPKYAQVAHIDGQDERGSDYQYYLCRPQIMNVKDRVSSLDRAFENIINHFEVLFAGNFGEDKDILIEFRSWVKHNLINYQQGEHLNREIPGQLSFNSLSLVQEHVALLSFNEKPQFVALMNFIAAVAAGSGVTVLVKNRKSFEWWGQIKSYFLQAGFDKKNIDLFLPTDDLFKKSLKEPFLSTIIVDGNQTRLQKILNSIYDGSCNEKRMKNIITNYDIPESRDFKRFLEQFSWTRSFAINTMRHGAPLNLELH